MIQIDPGTPLGTTLALSSGTSHTLVNGRAKEFLFRISGFGLLSEFGFRISDLLAPHSTQNSEHNFFHALLAFPGRAG